MAEKLPRYIPEGVDWRPATDEEIKAISSLTLEGDYVSYAPPGAHFIDRKNRRIEGETVRLSIPKSEVLVVNGIVTIPGPTD